MGLSKAVLIRSLQQQYVSFIHHDYTLPARLSKWRQVAKMFDLIVNHTHSYVIVVVVVVGSFAYISSVAET